MTLSGFFIIFKGVMTKNYDGMSAEAFITLFDAIEAALYVTDMETDELLFMNRAFLVQNDLEESAVGKPCYEVIQLRDARCPFCPKFHLARAPKDYVHWESPSPITGRMFSRTDCLIAWSGGKTVHLQHAVDITALKKTEAQLLEAKAAAEKANKGKSDFLASTSHELRTPLNAIIGLSEVELRDDHNESTRANLEKIYSAGKMLLSIINDILDLSKIEAGRLELVPGDYNLADLAGETLSLNMVRIGSKPIEFRFDIDEKLPSRLTGDDIRVKQIFSNLLSNAIKYTKSGSVDFNLWGEYHGDEFYLCAKVKDTGIGIRDEDIKQLFGEYSQVDLKSNRGIEGTGLGLSICLRLARMMDGGITVESEYGKGSEFTVKLRQKVANPEPLGEETAAMLRAFRFSGHSRTVKKIIYTPMPQGKVLVVDDVQTNIDVALAMMEDYGLKADSALSGEEALGKIRAGKEYDLILMDHLMSGKDGITTLAEIRALGGDYAAKVPVVALTANAIAGADKLYLSSGFAAFLTKPIDAEKLDAILRTYVPHQSIDGFDYAAGLARFNGNEATYRKILASFTANLPAHLEKLQAAFDAGDAKTYDITVHGIKSSCQGVGAVKAGESALELETLAKSGALDPEKHRSFVEYVRDLLEKLKGL
jgi:signal transduction histidine kinase/CheY-like chemotaxis protein